MSELLRRLPKIDRLAGELDAPHPVAIAAARQVVEEARAAILAGEVDALPDLVALARERARWLEHGRLVPVINASGVVVHTNLGRAPWTDSARAAADRVARYADLEMLLDTGRRGGRLRGVAAQLRALTGAEDALVVNNCAAAVLLALTALARGREVIVSRGELVEIGGSFRVPEVIASGGAALREVGTTNRTRAADYEAAIGPDTAMLLRVHPSNFRVVGFTEDPDRHELVAVGRRAGLPVVEDIGAGSLDGGFGEVAVREVVAAGVDLACFSGDKLLGGPQAGVVVGRAEWVQRLRKHPLYRALRVDKVVLAALEATLGDHLAGRKPPVLEMIEAPADVLAARARALVAALDAGGVQGQVVEDVGYVGGGALPGQGLPGFVVRVDVDDAEACARALRAGAPAVVARVHQDTLRLDVRTLLDDEVEPLARRVAEVLATR